MTTIDEFLQEIRPIKWFEHSKKATDEYYVIHSVFEAYGAWNEQMIKTWEPHICSLENIAVEKIGNEQIDQIFSIISLEIGNEIWKEWNSFINKEHLEEENGLEDEILDMVKRDVSWACIEKSLNMQGFFSTLLEIYKDGYFPCAWIGDYPNGKAVVL